MSEHLGQEDFVRLIFGEFGNAERLAKLTHLKSCPECRRQAETLGKLHAALREIAFSEQPSMPEELRKRARRASRRALRRARARLPRRAALRYVAVPLAAAAAVLLLLYVAAGRADRGLRAEVVQTRGAVELVVNGEGRPAEPGQTVQPGAGVRTGPGAHLTMRYLDGTTVDAMGNTELSLAKNARAKRIRLDRGEIRADVRRQPAGRPMSVTTPHAEAEVLGTRLRLAVNEASTQVEVTEGTVRLRRLWDGEEVEVRGGYRAVAMMGVALVAVSAAGEAPHRPADPRYLDGWRMAGANPERTSWVPEEVGGQLKPLWFKRIEPYIPQKVQVVAADGMLFISTARGLYALDADTGGEKWVYRTEMPLGHSPTVVGGVAYVGCFDRKLHAIGAKTGRKIWTFEGGAGFHTNPLVVEGRVYAGNRDGFFYAVEAKAGKLVWKFETAGPVLFSAAYKDGVVYFASNDSHAYSLDARSGKLVWKSEKLPGAGFHCWWPVVYRDRVIYAGSSGYRIIPPGPCGKLMNKMEKADVYPGYKTAPDRTLIGPKGNEPGDWSEGTPTIDSSRAVDYYQKKPWRRTYLVLDRATGEQREVAPILFFGTGSGNRYPPVVGGDGVLYQTNSYQSNRWIPRGGVTGWKFGTSSISITPTSFAVDEPMAIAAGGNVVHWTHCCNRGAGAFDVSQVKQRGWQYWAYSHNRVFPELYEKGWYFACSVHNDQNAPIPYRGKVYLHRYNAVHAFGSTGRPLAETRRKSEPAPDQLKAEFLEVKNPLPGLAINLLAEEGKWPVLFQRHYYMYIYPGRGNHPTNYYEILRVGGGDGKPASVRVERDAEAAVSGTATCGFGDGKTLRARVFRRAPGLLFENEGKRFRLTGPITSLAYAAKSGAKVVNDTGTLTGAEMAESWLVLWAGCEKIPQFKHFTLNGSILHDRWLHHWYRLGMARFRPLVISFEKRPDEVRLIPKGLEIEFPRAAGALVVTPLSGLHNPDPRQGHAWRKGLPQEVAERCRLLNRIARALPVKAADEWKTDGRSGDVTVTSAYRYREIADDWKTKPLKLAPLPPHLALAAWGKSPVKVKGSLLDLKYPVALGRIAGVRDSDRATATLPGLAGFWREPVKARPSRTNDPLRKKLAAEIGKMLDAGHLRPGYHSVGLGDNAQYSRVGDKLPDYFHNPAETVHTLIRALPHLSGDLREKTKAYLQREYRAYPPHTITHIGWKDGAAREVFDLPPEVEAARASVKPGSPSWRKGWNFPPRNFYALWKYAEAFGGAGEILGKCQRRLERPRYPVSTPYLLNSYLAGYVGYYHLARLAGAEAEELRDLEGELARLFVLRAALSKSHASLAESGFESGGYHREVNAYLPEKGEIEFEDVRIGGYPLYPFTVDFVNLVPEVGRFLRTYAGVEARKTVESYNDRQPYWFVAKGEETSGEGVLQPLYEYWAGFQGKAHACGEPREELEKYLDVPGFARGDLFYIQNLISTLEAGNR